MTPATDAADGDARWMRLALEAAAQAEAEGEVPVGAVVVAGGELLARAGNRPIGDTDPTAHAEICALRSAASQCGNYRLPDCTLYVTLEPCPMCAGAILHARLARVVFGAYDPVAGAVVSRYNLLADSDWTGGVLRDECAQQLQGFFRQRR